MDARVKPAHDECVEPHEILLFLAIAGEFSRAHRAQSENVPADVDLRRPRRQRASRGRISPRSIRRWRCRRWSRTTAPRCSSRSRSSNISTRNIPPRRCCRPIQPAAPRARAGADGRLRGPSAADAAGAALSRPRTQPARHAAGGVAAALDDRDAGRAGGASCRPQGRRAASAMAMHRRWPTSAWWAMSPSRSRSRSILQDLSDGKAHLRDRDGAAGVSGHPLGADSERCGCSRARPEAMPDAPHPARVATTHAKQDWPAAHARSAQQVG